MAGINKRVEHHLKDLINEKGNSNRCGECGADYPSKFNSTQSHLGVFLCGRCASVHRKLGPEISEVKSLTLDKWYESDLDFLSSIGNKRALQIWNPKKVPFPFDDDDKDEIFQYLRKKYVLGKFRYDPPTEEDYNLDAASQPSTRFRESSSRDRNSSRPVSSRASSSRSSFKPSSTGGSGNSSAVPALSHRDVPEIERLKYRKVEPQLQDRGFRNKDDNFEALFLARGDIKLAVRILENSPEHKPALPRRPVTASSTSQTHTQTKAAPASTSDWWNGNGASSSAASAAASEQTAQSATTFPVDPQTGLLEPPQQYLDPNTGIIYVDPVHQQQYLQQQEYVQQLQQQQQQQQIQSQPTGMSKNQLMSLYSTGSTQQINQQFQQPQIQQQVPTFQNTTTGQFQQPQFTQQFQQQQPQQPQFTGFQPQPQQQTYQQQFNPQQQGFNGF
ncbi:hypothetical protein WICPIJ_006370 [Wickerhamomyces pijperi]|uniref:Arf-GAP domain-containing protein n=1 Tax=Wickerhamomyces pijperi TaxID=599730 RepID=A0A9P8TLG2_WICPI|nr:hypothetical protein WICPIJ_006370 [Wickerhamomyces pijperi]